MFIELTPEQRQLQAELQQYFSNLISPEERAEMEADRHGKAYRAVMRRMGQDGKLGVGWPKAFGGLGFGPIEQQIFVNEAHRADVPLPAVTLQTVGPTLQVFGSEEQKKRFLPAILAGELHFAIGYTEPEAGTDLAALRTAAVRQGDEYIVNGQKIFTTGAHDADYIWLACRTDPDAVKHKGISILIVDTKDPGYSWTPIILSDGAHHTNATYYNDVRVPADMLVGEENGGWRLITTQLNNERVMLGPAGRFAAIYDRVHAWASKPGGDGITPIDHDDVKRALGEIHAIWRINELLNWQVAASGETIDVADAAATKVFGTERVQYVGRLAEQIVAGDDSDSERALPPGFPGYRFYRHGTRGRIHTPRIRNYLHTPFEYGGKDAFHRTHEVARVAKRRIALLLLLENRHRDFGEVVEHQVINRPAFHLTARCVEIIAPESLTGGDADNSLQLLSSERCGGSTNGPRCGPGLCSEARSARLSISRVFSG